VSGTHLGPAINLVIVPILETPLTWRARFLYSYPPETGWPDMTRALGSLSVTSYDSQGDGGGILSRLHTGN
jgi:hypothetical protein